MASEYQRVAAMPNTTSRVEGATRTRRSTARARRDASRPPPAVIDRLLAAVDLEALVREGTAVRRVGDRFEGVCPFHSARSDDGHSLVLDLGAHRFDCAVCGFGGTAIGWLMYHDGFTFPEALLELGRRTGIALDPRVSTDAVEASARDRDTFLADVAAAWHAELGAHRDAVRYLARRDIGRAMIERYGIGFAATDTRPIDHGKRDRRRRLWQHGLMIRRDGNTFAPRFRERVMFPIRDVRGAVIGFGGRTLDPAGRPKYLNSPSSARFDKGRVLYGLHEALGTGSGVERLVIVEGYLDVIALAGAGVGFAVATLGTAVTERHLAEALAHTAHVTLCLDGDAAGRAAAVRAVEQALPLLTDEQVLDVVYLPPGDDPDSFVRVHGAEAFLSLLGLALPLEEVLLGTLAEGCDLDEIGGQARFGSRVLAHVDSARSARLRQGLLDRASAAIGITLGPAGSD